MLLLPLPAADPGPEHGLPHDQGGAGVGRGGGRYGAPPPGEEEDDNCYDDDDDYDDDVPRFSRFPPSLT